MHLIPSTIGVQQEGVKETIRALLPDYTGMGEHGMGERREMARQGKGSRGILPMMNGRGAFGNMEMSGMLTILELEDDVECSADPGWDEHPPARVARRLEGQ